MTKPCHLCSIEAGEEVRHPKAAFYRCRKSTDGREGSCKKWRTVSANEKARIRATEIKAVMIPYELWALALQRKWNGDVRNKQNNNRDA